MYFSFFEKIFKGGISYISIRCDKANNQYVKSYDPKQESKIIQYLFYIIMFYVLSFFQHSGFK